MDATRSGPAFADSGQLTLPALLLHGGAGDFQSVETGDDIAWLSECMREALAAGWAVLEGGGDARAAVVEAVASLEDGGRFNAGRGAVSTSIGSYEFDAGVMDGSTGKVGAICAATWPANPVRVAAAIAEIGGPPDGPVLLAGAGADRFAEESGAARMTHEMLGWVRFAGEGKGLRGRDQREPAGARDSDPTPPGTVGAVAVDAAGHVAAATSTGGRYGQMPGRVGDTPIPGAGVWAADDTAAVSSTGAGEAFVVAGFCHLIHWRMNAGATLSTAMAEALDAVARLGGDGGAVSITPDGTFSASFNSRAMARAWRDSKAEVVRLWREEG